MPTNFPAGILSQGVPVIPGIPLTTGNYFFVHSGTGADSNSGRDKTRALATLQAAINKCAANKGDVIICMPGHAETVTATNINLNIAGVRVVGVGIGLARPTFTYGSATATITVSAANCGVDNCHHIANFLNVASAYTIGAAKDFTLSNSAFVDSSASLNFLCIVTTGSTANNADGLTVTGNYVWGLATTDGAVISILGATDRFVASYNDVDKAATNDAGHFITQAALVMRAARVFRNTLNVVGSAGAAVGVFATGSSTTNTGLFSYNLVTSLDTTTALFITAALNYAVHENYMSGAVASSGTLYPTADNPA